MSVDVDDVGMLCAAHALSDLGEMSILAVVHDANLDTGVGAISAINNYFSRSQIPVGAYRGPIGSGTVGGDAWWTNNGRGMYVDDLVAKFHPRIHDYSQVPAALTVYRQNLAEAADHEVTIVSVGFTTNLLQLLRSKPDEMSPLTGLALVEKKVQRLLVMGGFRSKIIEWNFGNSREGIKPAHPPPLHPGPTAAPYRNHPRTRICNCM